MIDADTKFEVHYLLSRRLCFCQWSTSLSHAPDIAM